MEDIYSFIYYDESNGTVGLGVAKSIEELELIGKTMEIVSWVNITGKEIEVGQPVVNGELKVFEEAQENDGE